MKKKEEKKKGIYVTQRSTMRTYAKKRKEKSIENVVNEISFVACR